MRLKLGARNAVCTLLPTQGERVPALISLLLNLLLRSRLGEHAAYLQKASENCAEPWSTGDCLNVHENVHLNVSALGHCQVSCYSTHRKEEPPDSVQVHREPGACVSSVKGRFQLEFPDT